MIVQFRNEKVSNPGSIPITIDCNVVAFIVFEEGFHQPIKRTKQTSQEKKIDIFKTEIQIKTKKCIVRFFTVKLCKPFTVLLRINSTVMGEK
ncbi:hypothetical protein TNCV_2059581 [Trichonephila clavipes]|uniref:Uncharacterized protein n=1 Tax=Trichonephila clavipes TaxID=2585209 RepID=A0A8X6R7C0_TRICX|nr:hypothetical protein TNCV_2059581 [Trichonephila clavipes]